MVEIALTGHHLHPVGAWGASASGRGSAGPGFERLDREDDRSKRPHGHHLRFHPTAEGVRRKHRRLAGLHRNGQFSGTYIFGWTKSSRLPLYANSYSQVHQQNKLILFWLVQITSHVGSPANVSLSKQCYCFGLGGFVCFMEVLPRSMTWLSRSRSNLIAITRMLVQELSVKLNNRTKGFSSLAVVA